MPPPVILHHKITSPQAIKRYFPSGNPEIVPISGGGGMPPPYDVIVLFPTVNNNLPYQLIAAFKFSIKEKDLKSTNFRSSCPEWLDSNQRECCASRGIPMRQIEIQEAAGSIQAISK